MLRCIKWAGLLSLLALTSCSYMHSSGIIQNRETDFLKAKSIPPLKIPAGLSSSTIESHYPVSEATYSPLTKPVDLTPPGLNSPMLETASLPQQPRGDRAKSLELSAKEEAELEAAMGNTLPKIEPAQVAKQAPPLAIPTQTTAIPIAAQENAEQKPLPQTLAAANKPHYNAPPSTTQKISTALKSMWPWKNKPNATEPTSVAQASAPTSKTAEMLSKLNAVWPWSSKKTG